MRISDWSSDVCSSDLDYAGLVNQNYQNQMNAYGAKMGGLFGLAGSLGGAAIMSDRRLKAEIKRVGKLDNGLNVYSYRYKAGGATHLGLMADEVEKLHPEAVVAGNNGFKDRKGTRLNPRK